MALDESKETDEQFDVDGIIYVVDKELIEAVKPIHIDFTPVGLSVTGNLDTGRKNNNYGNCG